MNYRILFTVPSLSLQYSKMPRILEICRNLDRQKFQPIVSVDHMGRLENNALKILRDNKIAIEIIRMSPSYSSLFRSLADMLKSIKKIRNLDISIQHSSDYSMGWSEPIIANFGGVKHWITSKTNSDFSSINWLIKFAFASKIIVQSPRMKDLLIRNYPIYAKKAIVIPNGVNLGISHPRLPDAMIRKELGISDSSLILGCIAHISPVKNHLDLIDAFLKSENREKIVLIIIGKIVDDKYSQKIHHLLSKTEIGHQVKFLGIRKDIPELCSVMDGIILTSKKESLSNAVLQGMACGLPVISSNVGGMGDIVQPNINGWLINLGENFVNDLTNAIDDWASSPEKRTRFGEQSIGIVNNGYSVENMVQKHIQLYECLIQ